MRPNHILHGWEGCLFGPSFPLLGKHECSAFLPNKNGQDSLREAKPIKLALIRVLERNYNLVQEGTTTSSLLAIRASRDSVLGVPSKIKASLSQGATGAAAPKLHNGGATAHSPAPRRRRAGSCCLLYLLSVGLKHLASGDGSGACVSHMG